MNRSDSKNFRLSSIDILRALTMFLMIFVNDLWTLIDIPKWLLHAKAGEDYLGFSDIIFPLFLFIVGLSIPLAIQNRQRKGNTSLSIAWHIIVRSVSLLIMGFFMVNKEYCHSESMIINSNIWMLLMAFGLSFIWIDWKRSPASKRFGLLLQFLGLAILVFLAVIYRGGTDGERWMRTYWWGILGLIGWAYFLNALIFLFTRGKLFAIVAAWMVFNLLSVAHRAGWMPDFGRAGLVLNPLLEGTLAGFTAAGVLATAVFQSFKAKDKINYFYLVIFGLAIASTAYGFIVRPLWGISKLGSTPSWLGICSGIGFGLFALLYWLADQKGYKDMARIIKPAGTATLTCYLLPYFIYPIREIFGLVLPEFLRTGGIGILKSLIFALLVVILTGIIERWKLILRL